MTAKLIDPNAAAKITDDLIERLSRAITTHSNDDFSKPKTLERNRFCTRSMAMIDARDHIQEQAARIEALERQVKALGKRPPHPDRVRKPRSDKKQ